MNKASFFAADQNEQASSFRDHRRPLLSRRRIQYAAAVAIGALLPWSIQGGILAGNLAEAATTNTLVGNFLAITLAFWIRLSVETYPGIRRSYVILPSALAGHGVIVVWFLFTRFPYGRIGLTLGFALHVLCLFVLYLYAERRLRRKIAVVPFGDVARLFSIKDVIWFSLKRPRLHDARGCDAIAADFSAELPAEWEAFLADAALDRRIVYQHKQLAESLTGRVELEHLSENSFGSLVPARGYFYLKSLIDFAWAVLMLPVAIPLMLLLGAAIRLDSSGPALFRQKRVGYSGREIIVYKFRTMCVSQFEERRGAAITRDGDDRVTRVGRILRKLRLDELPQIINILKWEMSWIGPRPEAKVLSEWYMSELSFYCYRHVVKPGISGWAQVNQGHVAEIDEVHRKLQFDFYYIKYFSPWLDVLILLRTIKTMMTGFGSR